jgi:hypothetical protein
MHTPEEQPWDGGDLLFEVQVENVEGVREDRPQPTIEIVIRHPDLSRPISIGAWEVQGSLGSILEALEAHTAEFLCNMEARVPEERRAALSSDDLWLPVHLERVDIAYLVRDCWLER